MMKQIFIVVAAIGLMGTSAHAWAPYFSAGGSLGFSLNGDSARSGGFSGALGVRYTVANTPMRTEFEYANLIYRKTYTIDTANGPANHDYDLDTQMYVMNIMASPKIPLRRSGLNIGLTAGAVTYKRDLGWAPGADDGRQTTFVYGATAGLGLNLMGGLYADVGVRYLRTLDDDVIDNLTPYFNLRYGF
ncbi:outer membrane beta-barrel protein [bacterium]|nr:outer membrane beta-barrel protein [bacterium]